jgi:hypothetical protein
VLYKRCASRLAGAGFSLFDGLFRVANFISAKAIIANTLLLKRSIMSGGKKGHEEGVWYHHHPAIRASSRIIINFLPQRERNK